MRRAARDAAFSLRKLPPTLVHEAAADPPGFRESVCVLFEEWVRTLLVPRHDTRGSAQSFSLKLQQQGMLKTDDVSTRWVSVK